MIKEVCLSDVCIFENGDRGKNYPSQSSFVPEGIPFINAGDLKNQLICSAGTSFITEEHFNKLSGGKIQVNDILFCLRGSLGKFAINKVITKGAIASSLVILRAKNNLSHDYLKHYLNSPMVRGMIEKANNGSSQPNLSASSVKNFSIPLPPLPVQQKIAAILDAADELRQKDKALVAKYDELTQALFLDMFGDPITNPKGWDKVELDSCLHKVEKIGRAYADDSIEYVDIASVDNIRNIITETTVYKTKDRPSRAQQILLSGDIVFSTVRPNLKNVALNHVDGRIGSTGFFVCRTENSKLNNFFLYKVLLTDSVTDYFVSITSGANYPAVKSTDMKKFQVICPTMNLQNKFAERVKVVEEQKKIAQASALKSEELFNGLLQRAFNGELV